MVVWHCPSPINQVQKMLPTPFYYNPTAAVTMRFFHFILKQNIILEIEMRQKLRHVGPADGIDIMA